MTAAETVGDTPLPEASSGPARTPGYPAFDRDSRRLAAPQLDDASDGGVAASYRMRSAAALERPQGDTLAWSLRSPRAWFEALWSPEPGPALRRIPGRETFAWSPPDGGPLCVVKRFEAGSGDARERWFERLHGRAVRSPARREFENLLELEALGLLRVPRALARFEEFGGAAPSSSGSSARQGRSAVVMEYVPHDTHLAGLLALGSPAPAVGAELLARVATLTARLHAAGWYHRDLYLQHWLLPSERRDSRSSASPSAPSGPCLIDVGRARREAHPRSRWFVKDLAALLHSHPAASSFDLEGFLAGYLTERAQAAGRAPDGRAVAGLARRVRAKAARLARHAPRFVDPRGAPSAGEEPS